jgi:hypothetical protein
MKPAIWHRAAFSIVLAGLPTQAMAQDDIEVDAQAAIAFWSHDFNLPENAEVAASSLKLGVQWTASDVLSTRAEVFGYTAFRDDGGRQRAELRTGVVIHEGDRHALRVGRQVEVWGKADKLNPTDSLSPRDFRILSSDDSDQRLGLTMVRADLALTDRLRLKTYWLPEFRPTTLIFPLSPQILLDRRDRDTGQVAAKLDSTGGAFDWSLSWYEGRDRIYDLSLENGGVAQRYNRIRVIGADMAGAAGPWGYRAEAAYTHTRYDPVTDPLVRRPEFWGVIGLDRNFDSGLYANVQASVRRVFKLDDLLSVSATRVRPQIDILRFQQNEVQVGFTGTLRYVWDDQRWAAEALMLQYVDLGQGLARLELRHQLSPQFSVRGRAQKFFGPKNSYFGQIRSVSAVSIEARVNF